MNALSDLNPVSRWLDVFGSIEHKINTLPNGVTFADVNCDMDYKLVIGDIGSLNNIPKLKFFKGISMINEIILSDIPSNVVSFFTNESVPRCPPAVAVSMCSTVYIYKNMKLFYKFYLPELEVSSLEIDIWRKLVDLDKDEEAFDLVEKLKDISYITLTPQSQKLLSLSCGEYISFIKQNIDLPLNRYSVITCMAVLNLNSVERDGVACLVLGTENGDILILDPQTYTVCHHAHISNVKLTPSHLACLGLYDIDYKIFIVTRKGSIYILKKGWLEGKCLVQLSTAVIEILIMPDNCIVVATMDKALQCYTKKGKRIWSLNLPNSISAMTLVHLGHLGINLIAVAMIGGFIQLYNGKTLVDTIATQETVSVIKFGQLGQEENVLIFITIDGILTLKILKRTADFMVSGSQKNHPSYQPNQQTKPLLVPKKSKLFLEQAAREREHAIEMHETFQRELMQLRLYVAKTTVEAMNSINSLNLGSAQPLKLTAKVDGLGPTFNVILTIENLSSDIPIINLGLLFITNNQYHKISAPYTSVPMILPGHPYIMICKITEIFEISNNLSFEKIDENDDINERPPLKVILIKKGSTKPLLASSIQIPPTDPLMVPFN